MGVSTPRASGCGSAQPQSPSLVPSPCRSIPGFPELLGCQSPPGAAMPESPWQPLSLSLRSQGSLASPLESPHGSVRDPSVPSSWEVTFQVHASGGWEGIGSPAPPRTGEEREKTPVTSPEP